MGVAIRFFARLTVCPRNTVYLASSWLVVTEAMALLMTSNLDAVGRNAQLHRVLLERDDGSAHAAAWW